MNELAQTIVTAFASAVVGAVAGVVMSILTLRDVLTAVRTRLDAHIDRSSTRFDRLEALAGIGERGEPARFVTRQEIEQLTTQRAEQHRDVVTHLDALTEGQADIRDRLARLEALRSSASPGPS